MLIRSGVWGLALRLALVGTICAATSAKSSPSHSHDDELKALATVMAIAQTASDRCSDILVSNAMLDQAPAFYHLGPGDAQAYQLAATLEMKRLAASIETAPSIKTWCDEAYRAYGPEGDVMHGLLSRQ